MAVSLQRSAAFRLGVESESLKPVDVAFLSSLGSIPSLYANMVEIDEHQDNSLLLAQEIGGDAVCFGIVYLSNHDVFVEHSWVKVGDKRYEPTMGIVTPERTSKDNIYFELCMVSMPAYRSLTSESESLSFSDLRSMEPFSDMFINKHVIHAGNE